MKHIRRLTTAFACAIGIALASAAVSAQAPDGSVVRYYRSMLRIGEDYTLRAGEVARQVNSLFGDVTLEGRVEENAVVVFGNVRATSTAVIRGSLVVVAGGATIDRGAAVGEDLVVIGGTLVAPTDFSTGGNHVVVGSPGLGRALGAIVPWLTRGLLWGRLIVPGLGWMWVLVGVVFLVYLAINTLFDWPVRNAADAVARKPLTAFLMGLLVLVLSVPALVVLAATVIGLAVVPFVLCAMVAGAVIGKAGVARAIGGSLVASSHDSKLQSLRSFLIGSVAIVVAYMVPVVGVVAWGLTTVVGIGAAALMARAALRREHPARERIAAEPAAPQGVQAAAEEQGRHVAPGQPLSGAAAAPPAPPVNGDLALLPRATFLDRVVAFALDCLLVGIAVQVFGMHHDGSFPLLLFLYHLAFWAWKGTTLGGIVVGLRVIRTPGTEVRFADALVRVLAAMLSLAALGIGCFWMLQDPERQMWHDKIAGTLVVRVPRELVLA